jgi:hypothetical protein
MHLKPYGSVAADGPASMPSARSPTKISPPGANRLSHSSENRVVGVEKRPPAIFHRHRFLRRLLTYMLIPNLPIPDSIFQAYRILNKSDLIECG